MRRIALITDFGTRDPYVAAVKGVIAARTDAPVVDCSHDIEPFDIWHAAFFLRAIEGYWPAGTIFMIVVDPGVGSERRIVAVESAGKMFLAPDNGVLTFAGGAARSVENESLFLPGGSTTFHGRDRFAPVAAALANGLPVDQLGPAAGDRIVLDYRPPSYDRKEIEGTIVNIDRFGNAVSDLERAKVPFARFALRAGGQRIDRLQTSYRGEGIFLIVGSTGCIEISMSGASAATQLRLRRGDRVTVAPA